MKIKVIVSTDGGCSYEGEVQLAPIGRKKTKSETPAKSPQTTSSNRSFDFTLPLRAFVTANGARKLSGQQKFVLLLGGLTKGDTTASMDIDRVQKEWNKMTAPMGGAVQSRICYAGERQRLGGTCQTRNVQIAIHVVRCNSILKHAIS